ncbi:MAG: MATE family efflux transporter [Eubacteriales bacterium]|nr:MATE family efflux transporter [Eubacteriales bacterium]
MNTRQTYQGILKLTLPIVLQNLLSAMVSSADVIMLNSVGQSAIASVSLATQYSGILFMVFYGLGTGVIMLSAQYWGKRDLHAIQLIQGIALRFSLIISLLAALCAFTIPSWMMKVFTNDPELISMGAGYLRVVAVSYVFWGISEIFLASLRSVERVTISTFLNALALGLNVVLNGVFIYGLFGAPRLGVLGVALATSISRGVQLAACMSVSLLSKDVKLRFSGIFVRNKVLFQDFVRLALPALGNDMVWSVAFSLYSSILGHMGSDIVAANSIVVVVRNFATVLCYGFGNASTIWLGKEIGQDHLAEAKKDAGRFVFLTVLTGALGGVLILLASPFVMSYASLSGQALHYLKYMLYINSYYVIGTALNTTLIAGVFRAGGDSRFGFICDFIDMWAYAVPLGFFSAFVLKLPPLWVYFLLCTDEFVKWPWVIRRYLSGRWLNNITKDYEKEKE